MSKNNLLLNSIIIDSHNPDFAIENNKYFLPILMAYYMNTRNVSYVDAVEFFDDFQDLSDVKITNLIQEYYRYAKGGIISEGQIDNKFVLPAPKYKTTIVETQLSIKLLTSIYNS